ncbi:hypothetical protein E2P71_00395 [Candidatus Bathyarchaeota archaeon]|nr:hypothetical protein E2P71_00395 [Candidatus Bathyarchaeota archaeon]
MRLRYKILLSIPVIVLALAVSLCLIGQYTNAFLITEVWSQNSPAGESYEYKVNEFQCALIKSGLERGFLSTLDAVRVITPDGGVYWLNRDFNINEYSGEVTRRYVLYGPEKAELPVSGKYRFEFIRDDKVVHTKTMSYVQSKIDYPTDIRWERRGDDLYVSWTPPEGMTKDNWYKVLVWNMDGTPELFISLSFDGDAAEGLMEDVPLVEDGEYQVNVAVYYHEGYAYTDSYFFRWDQNASEIEP